MAVYAVLAMGMSLSVFPWDRIQASGELAATLVSSIQFPNRFLTIANVMLCVLAGMIYKHVKAAGDRKRVMGYLLFLLIFSVCSNLYLLEDEMERDEAIRVHNAEGMGTGYISGAEYLPYGADPAKFIPHDPVASAEIFMDRYEKKTLGASLYAENPGQEAVEVSFPLLYYKGYQAKNSETGERLPVVGGENFEVNVVLPPQFSGNLEVKFVEPFSWRIAELVTLLTVGVLLWSSFRKTGKVQE